MSSGYFFIARFAGRLQKVYKRILLKISGEQLSGRHDVGIDPEVARYLAQEVKQAFELGCSIAVIVGGGNMVRGEKVAGNGIRRVTADQMGMLSGLMNAMALTDIFEHSKISTRCLSQIIADQVAEPYSYRRAMKHMRHNHVVIIAGGIARPFFTHDTAAVSHALELECDVMLKATKVDGVYDKDPAKHKNSKLIHSLTFQEAIENTNIAVMDKAALGLAMEHKMPVVVFNPFKKGNLQKIVSGEHVGTIIS